MSQTQKLKTQRSQKSLPPQQQQTYHVLPTTVNNNAQNNPSNLTEKNLSIINQSQNQIPSINQEQKSQQDNQANQKMENKQDTIIENANKSTQKIQSQKQIEKKKQQKGNQEKKQILKQQQEKQHKQKLTENKDETNKEKKDETNKEKKDETNKEKKDETNKEKKDETNKEKKDETNKEKKDETNKEKKDETKNSQYKIEESDKMENTNDQKSVKKVLDNEVPVNKQSQKAITNNQNNQDKNQSLVKSIKQNRQPSVKVVQTNQEQIESEKEENLSSIKVIKRQQAKDLSNQRSNQKIKSQKQSKQRVETKDDKKKQQERNQKENTKIKKDSIISKTQNVNKKGQVKQDWNSLLLLFLQRVQKVKNKHSVSTKQKREKQGDINQLKDNDKTDINIQLGSSSTVSSLEYENKIKLEFRLYQELQADEDFCKENEQQKPKEGDLEDSLENEKQIQSNINKRQKINKDKHETHPFQLTFAHYDLKNQKNIAQKSTLKINNERLKNKLQSVTQNLDKDHFSFLFDSQPQKGQKQSKQKQNRKKDIKTRMKFNFSQHFIQENLNIQKEKLEKLKEILFSYQSKDIQQFSEQLNGDKNSKNEQKFLCFCELLTKYPLKTIEPIKFLQFMLGGFKLRIFKDVMKNVKLSASQSDICQILYDSLLSIFPEQITSYIEKILSGKASIKFKSIDNLTKLLTRLGINQLLSETPTVKELLGEIVENFQELFGGDQQHQEQYNDNIKNLLIWKLIETVFEESKCEGVEMQIRIFHKLGIRMILQSKQKTIKQLYRQLRHSDNNS